MTDQLLNVLIGLLTSAIGAGLAWLAQSVRRRRLTERRRAFFGMPAGTDCLVVVNRQISGQTTSVHRDDVSALMELAILVNSCGARPEIMAHDLVRQGLGDKAEFCVGGPYSNDRTAAHLGWRLPSVRFGYDRSSTDGPAIVVGDQEFRLVPDGRDTPGWSYALLARLDPGGQGRPVFLIAGQVAIANHAAVRYLVAHERQLTRRYGLHGTFALMLRVVNPTRYGPDVVERVADVTDAAAAPAATAPATAPATAAPSTGSTG
ncbi:hypothetical protein OG455_24480 [Kitasatospora sp. NBC_01287]|uniref:hypothetical protein n=1 Tax=Kitasatospora sp. NBC_01287 TaxID=2903573 RepID=UPI002252C7E6|nr:hypothetical protein [Kitasatospora sp. NBC_01287]MCX4748636.1 hypothetical protein [Kitasatospora sp. NBC_01287]